MLLKNNIKIIKNERMVLEMKIIKQELEFEECLKQRLEFICEFSKVTPIFVNGSIRKLERTLQYINTHTIITDTKRLMMIQQ